MLTASFARRPAADLDDRAVVAARSRSHRDAKSIFADFRLCSFHAAPPAAMIVVDAAATTVSAIDLLYLYIFLYL